MTRRLVALLAVACVLLAGVGAAAATPATQAATSAPEAVSGPVVTPDLSPNNTTTTTTAPPENETSGGESRPEIAETARILPVNLESDVQKTTVASQGETFNTSGPFALFSVSEPVEQVAIQQDGAKASVLEGGQTVRVQYADDAAPVGKQSLYNLQIWFADDSSRSVELYAERTSISTGAASMKKYRPAIQDMLSDAEESGFERSPDGLENYYEATKEKAELLDHLLTKQAARLFASLVSIVANPLGIALVLGIMALLAVYLLRNNRQVLEILTNATGKSEQLRERLWIEYRKQQQSAADEKLRELDGVREMGEIYWSDAFEVDTTYGLAELFRDGVPVRRDGEIVKVGGVENLEADTIESGWIEAVCRPERLSSPEIALSHGQKALHRMITKYGMAHHYEDAYRRCGELLDELDESRDVSQYAGTTTSNAGGAVAGGDD
ncbi:hypothetical protein [Halorubellus salinus]|uniref:hypothetical protein n=1 Tax=Halorubellus salinus TaxID=755309 RepID=UPI001D060398|nr:hypothetical protein [Halorubellus salinus]